MTYLTREEIRNWGVSTEYPSRHRYADRLISRLKEAGQWDVRQLAGHNWAMGCVALEVTQRCNLDCTLCYLSENSEAVLDLPLPEIFRRIENIRRHFGPGTSVQVTGGDPTLRKREELAAIVRRIRDLGMQATLFTNGIRATRSLLAELVDNGLDGVAFHVDITQRRKGYPNEAALNDLRKTYIDRARGLPLAVYFNTTVCAENFAQIPGIVRFFRAHSGSVSLASFQPQAETGRGVLRRRAPFISPESVAEQISRGAGRPINFDVARVGHESCNKYAVCLSVRGNLYNLFEDTAFMMDMFAKTRGCTFDRKRPWRLIAELFSVVLANPRCWANAGTYLGRKLWEMRWDLLWAGGRVGKLSFFIHNFMDASQLEEDRCRSCVFMAATAQGPISMCVHNAKRDEFLLKPFTVDTAPGWRWWHPLYGYAPGPADRGAHSFPLLQSVAVLPTENRKGRGGSRREMPHRSVETRPVERD
ncbi:MAG: radical SAM protein [SAR324 cluster bacterium]|nr:radical SAM protein [SAR324 cluster bacterium]MCZ6728484.1 radical SAM protein [SAR324 cluster bacterium]